MEHLTSIEKAERARKEIENFINSDYPPFNGHFVQPGSIAELEYLFQRFKSEKIPLGVQASLIIAGPIRFHWVYWLAFSMLKFCRAEVIR